MPKVTVYNQQGAIIGSQDLSDKVFGVKPKAGVVHQVVVAMFANRRQVLAHTKDKGEVRGGGRKPWRQKGTGRARHGSIRSPLWVGGGITFGPTKARNFKQKINKKTRRKAILMCLSDRVKDGKFVLLDKLSLDKGKTREVVKVADNLRKVFYGDEVNKVKNKKEIKKLGQPLAGNKEIKNMDKKDADKKEKSREMKSKKILVLLENKDEKIRRACRNISWLTCLSAQDVNVVDILKNEFILTSVAGVKKIEDILAAKSLGLPQARQGGQKTTK